MSSKVPIDVHYSKALDLLPPFPVVLVTTQTNIITINQIHYFTFAPLRIGIGVARTRRTFDLLKSQREFVINVPTPQVLQAVRLCGKISGRDSDKFQAAHLEMEPSQQVAAPSIRECPAHIECRMDREVEFEDRVWFIGMVVACRADPAYKNDRALLCGRTSYRLPGEIVAMR